MKAGFRRFLIIAVALLVLALSVAPVALRAAHHGHFCAHAGCPVCTVIRNDLTILKIIAAALAAFALRAALLHTRAAAQLAAHCCAAFLPIESKVRLNN